MNFVYIIKKAEFSDLLEIYDFMRIFENFDPGGWIRGRHNDLVRGANVIKVVKNLIKCHVLQIFCLSGGNREDCWPCIPLLVTISNGDVMKCVPLKTQKFSPT